MEDCAKTAIHESGVHSGKPLIYRDGHWRVVLSVVPNTRFPMAARENYNAVKHAMRLNIQETRNAFLCR